MKIPSNQIAGLVFIKLFTTKSAKLFCFFFIFTVFQVIYIIFINDVYYYLISYVFIKPN